MHASNKRNEILRIFVVFTKKKTQDKMENYYLKVFYMNLKVSSKAFLENCNLLTFYLAEIQLLSNLTNHDLPRSQTRSVYVLLY